MRRYDIDALRVIVFGLLIFYHVGMFFVPWGFHIKNPVTYEWLKYPMLFLNKWRLPLLFVISGMGTFFNISKKSGWGFIKERFVRLFIPLVVGIIFIVPPQVYFERLDTGQFTGNYFDFWPLKAFIGVYPEGNFSWHHLWFLPYLWLYSLVLTPIFLYLKNHPQAWFIRKMKNLVAHGFGLYLLAIPLFIAGVFLSDRFPSTHALVNDWCNHAIYGTLLFYGFLLVALKDDFWENMIKNRKLYLMIAITAFAILMYIQFGTDHFPNKAIVFDFIGVINGLSWILALIAYSATYLNKPSRMLSYANEAVYPFYILHQTVMIAFCYYLKDVDMCLAAKFFIMATGTFGISWLIYEFGIRRYAWIRPLFGMKKLERNYTKHDKI